MLNGYAGILLDPIGPSVGGLVDVAGHIGTNPDNLRIVRIDSQAENRKIVAGRPTLTRNAIVARKPGVTVIRADVNTAVAIGSIPGIRVGEVVANIIAQAATGIFRLIDDTALAK